LREEKIETLRTGNGGNGITAGNNAFTISFQDQDATATNDNRDSDDNDDDFTTTQVDVCAVVLVGIIC
jgi:hypothetical protein